MNPTIIACQEQVKAAQKRLNAQIQAEFPVGARITWLWQGAHDLKHSQFGEVVRVDNCWWSEPRIRVRNEYTGRTVEVRLHQEPRRIG